MKKAMMWSAVGGAVLLSAPSDAELNVPIAARVVSFLQPAPTGPVQAAILFAADNPASVADAAAIERALGGGATAGKATIRARRVSANGLDSLSGFRVAFVAQGTRAAQDAIAQAAARASVVTITSDQACVQSGRCIVGIAAGPRVQITVNRAAARAANVKFGSAFLMLVKEI